MSNKKALCTAIETINILVKRNESLINWNDGVRNILHYNDNGLTELSAQNTELRENAKKLASRIKELEDSNKQLEERLEAKPAPTPIDTAKPYYIEGKGIFIPIINKVLDLEDMNDGDEMEWNDAIEAAKNNGKELPTIDDWHIIWFFRKEIQSLLEEHGKPLQEDYYWSSTEYSASTAWLVNFGSGNFYDSFNKYYSIVVRAVAAFSI